MSKKQKQEKPLTEEQAAKRAAGIAASAERKARAAQKVTKGQTDATATGKCPFCGGTGTKPGQETCFNCSGSGVSPTCNGTGTIPDGGTSQPTT